MKHRLANFLFRYRTTPHSVTGVSPAELMVKRPLRTRLSLVKPDLAKLVETKQEKQKFYHDKTIKDRSFKLYDRVRVRNKRPNSFLGKWIPGTIVIVCGPRNYIVKVGYSMRYVHTDHLIKAHDNVSGVVEPEIVVPEFIDKDVSA